MCVPYQLSIVNEVEAMRIVNTASEWPVYEATSDTKDAAISNQANYLVSLQPLSLGSALGLRC